MADKLVTIDVQSNLKEQTVQAKNLNNELDKTERTRKSATRTGSRAADAALGASEAGTTDTGLRRGTTGAGGRGGERDFARQAQGLGGLVHLYATFAANIYAVGAAFSALQKAADFERMEKSAARMSVVLGLNLNSAAKSMVALTDGALSYAESIEKVNLAGSAGLSSKQITALTKVAKGASAALGRDMGDSMNRLFKGAIKLEPELLDELGILTKASEAYKTYAAGINKTEDELTKFEKTQAFTNAIIAEGNAKFASLYDTIEANPYTKLQAKLQDIAKESLGAVNTGLKPLIGFLSENPTALLTAVTLLVGKLVNMAIPSMGEFGEKAKRSAETAKNSFESLNRKFSDYSAAMVRNQREALRADASYADEANRLISGQNKKVLELNTLLSSSFSEMNKKASKPIMDNIFGGKSVDNAQIAINKFIRSLDAAERASKRLTLTGSTPEIKTSAAERITAIAALRTQLKGEDFLQTAKEFNDNLKVTESLESNLLDLEKKVGFELDKNVKARIQQRIKMQEVKAEAVLAARMAVDIGAKFGDVWKLIGSGWQVVSKELVEGGASKLSLFVKKAAFYGMEAGVAFGSALMKGIGRAMNVLMIVSIIKDVFIGGLASIIGEAKSLGDLNQIMEESADSHKLLSERVSEVSKLFFEGSSNIQYYAKAMQLAGTTLNSTVDNLDKSYEAFRKVQLEMQNGATWTKWTESIKSMWGEDVGSKTAKAQATALQDALSMAQKLGKGTNLKLDLAKALKIEPASIDNATVLNQKLKEINESGDYLAKEQIKKALEGISRSAMNSASRVSELSEALAEANKAANTMDIKTEFKNPKYEPLANFIKNTLKLAETDAKEANILFSQMFADMEPALIKELSGVDSTMKNFFSSDLFVQNKMNKIFDTSEAHKDLVAGLSAMKATIDAFFANPAVLRVQVDPGTGVETFITDKAQVKLLAARVGEQMKYIQTRVTDKAIEDQSNTLEKASDSQRKTFIDNAKSVRTEALNNLRLAQAESEKLQAPSMTPEQYASTEARVKEFMSKGMKAASTVTTYVGEQGISAAEKMAKDLAKLRSKSTDGLSFPKDRLRAEKAEVETLKYKLHLIEQEIALNEQNLKIADERFGLAGTQYNELLDQKANLFANAEMQKYTNSLKEAELKLEENILSIKNDKNTLDKESAIATVTLEYQRQKKLLEEGLPLITKRIENEKSIVELQKIQKQLALDTSKVTLAASGMAFSKTISNYALVSDYSKLVAKATAAQLQDKTALLQKTIEEVKASGYLVEDSAEVNRLKAEQLDLAVKLYETQKLANQENLKAFELTAKGGIGDYFNNFGKEFAYQINDALASAKSATEVLVTGVISGIDNTISELTMRLKEGNLSISEVVKFARNQLADAFQKSAAQVLQNGWKQLVMSLVPSLQDPLTSATVAATISMQTLAASINALNVTMGGAAVAGPTTGGAGGGIFGLIASGIGSMFGSGMVTGTPYTGGVPGPTITPMGAAFAKGGVMTEYGPVKLSKYADGGVASGPQLALYGEGSKNEAYVPLPDNRTIPVTLSGNTGSNVSMGDTIINVSVDASTGSATVDSNTNAEMAKSLGLAIKKTVHDELINQVRPGGMFYRG